VSQSGGMECLAWVQASEMYNLGAVNTNSDLAHTILDHRRQKNTSRTIIKQALDSINFLGIY
jgi:hypothetical protein